MGKSAFFHVGLNRSKALELGIPEIRIRPDGSTYFKSYFENHEDPVLTETSRSYGDDNQPNMSIMLDLSEGDWAWFIESVSVTPDHHKLWKDWGYHIVYGFDVETRYYQRRATGHWEAEVSENHDRRMRGQNPHYPIWKNDCVVILGKETSKDLFKKPLRISVGVDPYPWLKEAMGIPVERRLTPTTAPRWWQWKDETLGRGDTLSKAILQRVDCQN